ncbi:MAG: Fur family transcriptional regulator [Opitutales bacterium]
MPTVPSDTQPVSDDAHNTFTAFLNNHGLRVTGQRLAIFEAGYSHEDHFTAEDLLAAARERDKSVSRATVYRTLPILVESGLLREVDVGRDYKFYMSCRHATTFQAQVICQDCDKIYEIDAPFMEWYGKSVANKLGMEIVDQRLQVSARCKTKDGTCRANAAAARAFLRPESASASAQS